MYHTTHNYTCGLLSQKNEDVCSQKILDKSVLHSSTCNILKLEASQMSFTGKTKQTKKLMALLYSLEIKGKNSARVAIHDYNPSALEAQGELARLKAILGYRAGHSKKKR